MTIYTNILVPLAPGSGDEAERAMSVARSLLAPGGGLTLISVFEELPRYLAAEPFISDPLLEKTRAEMQDDLLERFAGEDVEVVLESGNPTREILDLAKARGHDCIVIASAQPGWHTFFLGSTASGVVRHARCAVHVLRDAAADDDS